MSDRLCLGMGSMNAVSQAEDEARRMMDAADWRWGDCGDEKWVDAFGDREWELEEQRSALARRYRSIPFWRRRERKAVLEHYISVEAMLTVAHGCETVWG